MTIKETLDKACVKYSLSPLDAGILLSLAGNFSKEYILAHPEKKLSAMQTKKFDSFCARRARGEPVAYIAGKKEFFGLEFLVNKNVLIPRPETELLVEETIENINSFFCHPGLDPGSSCKSKIVNFLDPRGSLSSCNGGGDDKLNIIDVGTGSGNIIISIAKNIPDKIKKEINFYAIDISKESLRVAKANAKKYKLNKKIKFIQSDALEYFQPEAERKTKLENIFIVANLPYVSSILYKKNYKNLKYEPKKALVSDNKGLEHYQKLFKQMQKLHSQCRMLRAACFFEISPEQKPRIGRIIKKYWPKAKVEFFRDLVGKWRMAEIKTSP